MRDSLISGSGVDVRLGSLLPRPVNPSRALLNGLLNDRRYPRLLRRNRIKIRVPMIATAETLPTNENKVSQVLAYLD